MDNLSETLEQMTNEQKYKTNVVDRYIVTIFLHSD